MFRGATILPATPTTSDTDSNNAAAGVSNDDDVYIAVIAIVSVLTVGLVVVLAVFLQRSRREPNIVVNNPPADKGGVSDVDEWFASEGTATSFRGFDGATQTHYYGPVATKTRVYPKATQEKTYLDPHAVHTLTPNDASSAHPTHFYPADSSGWNPNFA